MKILVLLTILFISNFQSSNKILPNKKDSVINSDKVLIQIPKKIEIVNSEITDKNEWDNRLPWIAALFIGVFTIIANLYLSKALRKSAKENLESQIKSTQKIALNEFKSTIATQNRQNWINDVRETLTEFLTFSILASNPQADTIDHIGQKVVYSKSKLQLLLNTNKKEQESLINKIEELMSLVLDNMEDKDKHSIEKISTKREEVIKTGRKVFDLHWKKIKNLK